MKNLPEVKSELFVFSEIDKQIKAELENIERPEDEEGTINKNTKCSGQCCCRKPTTLDQ